MSNLYKKVEVVGTSPVSFSEAVKNAVSEASRTIRNITWFEVIEERGRVKDGAVVEFQATVKLGFRLERE